MSALYRRVEDNPVTFVAQSISKLDIFHFRPDEPLLVEHADVDERCFACGTTSCPETFDITFGMLMRIRVKKISVLRYDPLRSRGIVVRTENGVDIIGLEMFEHPAERIAMNHHIGVDERDDVCAGFLDAAIASECGTFCIGIIDDDQLPFFSREIRCFEGGDAVWEVGCGRVRGYDDAEIQN